MPRVITVFDKVSDDYIGKYTLPEIDLNFLRKVFEVKGDNPMYDCWKISEEQCLKMKEKIDFDFEMDFEGNEYFIEYDSEL